MSWKESVREDYLYGGKPEVDDYEDFWLYCGNLQTAFPEWRKGQTLFNALENVRPDLSVKVRTTDLDPFYRDDRIPAFTDWLYANWDAFLNCF